jgi:uncharacterized protein
MLYQLTHRFQVSVDLETCWAFFSDAQNLPKITPPAMGFSILTPRPIVLSQGSVLDYRIRWAGLPLRWRTRIIDWSPPHKFVDLQVRGPYALWHHQHVFHPVSGGVECLDRVLYRLPLGLFGRLGQGIVRRQLMEIFRFRQEAIGRLLGPVGLGGEDARIERVD